MIPSFQRLLFAHTHSEARNVTHTLPLPYGIAFKYPVRYALIFMSYKYIYIYIKTEMCRAEPRPVRELSAFLLARLQVSIKLIPCSLKARWSL